MNSDSLLRPGWSETRLNVALTVSSGLLLGLSFPPSPFYSLAYVAFIPFLYLMERMNSYGQFGRYAYLFLFVFHVLTVYWTGGYTHGKDAWLMTANAAMLAFHPFFYLPSILLAFFVRRNTGVVPGLVSFGLFWVSFEYVHSLGELSFPWIIIGNSQAYDLARIQIAEYTSAYGLSFLIFAFNIVAFLILTNITSGKWKPRSVESVSALVLLLTIYIAPWIYGRVKLSHVTATGNPVSVGIIQPNFDPWEKWGEGYYSKWESYTLQLRTYLDETRRLGVSHPDLILWPETAIPFQVLLPRYSENLKDIVRTVDSLNVSLFTGLAHAEFVDSARASATAQRIGSTNIFAESYNSAVLIEPAGHVGPVYKKMVLVPFGERIPYANALKFLIEPLKWEVGISSWGMGKDTLVYRIRTRNGDEVAFSGMICYESVYPDFVRQFVKRGAQFLVVLTNDSWWGNTSGAYQHAAYASLRAVENRRWVVQCANGGISEFVDPFGVVHISTRMFSTARWISRIQRSDEMTFYTRYGDVFAQGCLYCSGLFVILAMYKKRRKP